MDMAPAAFADRILETAGIGGWEFDVLAGRLLWSALTFRIHEVDPSAQPDLEGALDFYAPEARPVIAKAVQDAIDGGTPWNLELPFITARGRRLWVRACGQAVRAGGRTVKLVGAFEDITERRDLAERAGRLSVVARQMTNAVIMTDADGLTLWVNDAFCRLTGFTIAEVRGRKPGAFLQGPATDPATVRHMAACLARGEGFEVEIVNYNKLRVPYRMAVTCTALRDEAGALTGFIAVESDITARRAAEEEVRRQSAERHRAEALLRDVLEALPSAVTAYDSHERLILTNRSYAAMFPIAAQFATPGRRLEEIIRQAAEAGQYSACGAAGEEREAWVAETLRQTRQTGITHTLALSGGRFVLARESRSETGNLVCVRTDTTELQQAEAALRTLAEQDSLTGLANRACLLAALERQLGRAVADDGAGGALLLFDVDHFKQINDTLGHDAGDGVLVELAGRLRAHIRGGDVAARLGGTSLPCCCPDCATPRLSRSG
jgi:PAS domain S-box-containing protein